MPTYDFQCKGCGQSVTVTVSMSELRTPACLACNTNMHRIYNLGAIKFKGSGFYTNDKREDQ